MAWGAARSSGNCSSLPQHVPEPLGAMWNLPSSSQEAAANGSTFWPPPEFVLPSRGGSRFAEVGETD